MSDSQPTTPITKGPKTKTPKAPQKRKRSASGVANASVQMMNIDNVTVPLLQRDDTALFCIHQGVPLEKHGDEKASVKNLCFFAPVNLKEMHVSQDASKYVRLFYDEESNRFYQINKTRIREMFPDPLPEDPAKETIKLRDGVIVPKYDAFTLDALSTKKRKPAAKKSTPKQNTSKKVRVVQLADRLAKIQKELAQLKQQQ